MPPREYERSTRAVHPLDIPSDLLDALRQRAARDDIGLTLATAEVATVTTSVHERKRLGRTKRREQRSAVILAPPWLLWAMADGDDPPVPVILPLSTVELSSYAASPLADLIADQGLLVASTRLGSGTAATGSVFIGLGPEPAAESFTATLAQAVRDAGGVVRMSATS